MPTPPKNSINMRKHLTKSEKESRRKAEGGLKRRTRVTLKMPTWLSEKAQGIWKDLRKKVRGLELLDNIDAEMLGIYCDVQAKYREASEALGKPSCTEEDVKEAQAWARVALAYAEKLGISPTARARLAKRKAEREDPDEMEQLLEDVRDFVNE